jgi:hypothetical protein
MNSNNKNTKQANNNNETNPLRGFDSEFHMDIKDDFIDPLDTVEQKMFGNVFKDFGLLSEEQQQPKEEKQQHPMENGTVISQVYCSSYNNINGQPKQECYQSQSIKQMNQGHNICEAREAYKNSDGVMKTAYQRGLDKKGAKFIKEKNTKTGIHHQQKVLKGIKENEIDGFNKEYEQYRNKCGLKNYCKALNGFNHKDNRKQIGDGRKHKN